MLKSSNPVNTDDLTLVQFPFRQLAIELRQEKGYGSSGKSARSLVRGESLTIVLIALKGGATLHDHPAPGPATVLVLEGKVEFCGPNGEPKHSLVTLDSVAFPAGLLHSVHAVEDSLLQVVIGGRT